MTDTDSSRPALPRPGRGGLVIRALEGIPLVGEGDDLAALVEGGLRSSGLALEPGDILAVAQKIVSKAEGRLVRLASVTPGPEALELARVVDKDPRVVELVLRESTSVLRAVPGVLVVETRHGIVMANAGIDHSNVGPGEPDELPGPGGAGRQGPEGGKTRCPEDDRVLLLPRDPDASAARLREALRSRTGVAPGVIVSDSVGRAWREGTVGLAIGVSGLPARVDLRGGRDLFGRELRVSEVGFADELASAANLVMGEGAEGRPVALLRGYPPLPEPREDDPARRGARDLVRPRERDLFR